MKNIVKEFKSEGKTVIFITHKLKEVMEISDCVTVLSKGRVTYEKKIKDEKVNINELSRAITGKSENPEIRIKGRKGNEACVIMKNVSFEKNKFTKLRNLNLILNRGEIYGICGVEGNGQNEITDILMGFEKDFIGEIAGLKERKSIIPDDRIKKGMIKEFNIGENFVLKEEGNKFITDSLVSRISEEVSENYDVRLSSADSPLESLSGGNQQKVIFAREIEAGNNIIILMHPTRGVDINATNFIHSKILEERRQSKAILLISSDLDELLILSDRIGVIYNGSIIREFGEDELKIYTEEDSSAETASDKKDILFEKIGKYMLGITDEK